MASLLLRMRLPCLLGLLVSGLPLVALQAQPPRHYSGRDPFFEALREVHHESPSKELFDLLHHPTIRQEVGLDDPSYDQLKEKLREAVETIFAVREANRSQSKSKDQLKQEIRDAVAPIDSEIYSFVESHADLERLLGLYAQARAYRSAVNEKIASRIGLQGDELAAFRDAKSKLWRNIMEETRSDIQRAIRKGSGDRSDLRAEIGKLVEHAEEKLDAKLQTRLTAEQRKKLEELKGTPFNLPEPLFDQFRGNGRRRHDESRAGGHEQAASARKSIPTDADQD